mmetsp:Transcript_51989/g.153315  ORF Transcript_51989/g.153315 Transcript_51989/m.153315 type:complete len:257 (-) Transcript_51989:1210-1980(-)
MVLRNWETASRLAFRAGRPVVRACRSGMDGDWAGFDFRTALIGYIVSLERPYGSLLQLKTCLWSGSSGLGMPTSSCSKNSFWAFLCAEAVMASASMGGSGLTALCTSCLRQPIQSVPWPFGQIRLGSSSSRPPPPAPPAAAAASAMASRDSRTPICVSISSRISSHFSEASKKRWSASARALAWAASLSRSACFFASMASLDMLESFLRKSSSSKSSSRSVCSLSRSSLVVCSSASMSSTFPGHSASSAWASSSSS